MATSDSTSFPSSKLCTRCGVEKELSEFHRSPKSKYGRRTFCKQCRGVKNPLRMDFSPVDTGIPNTVGVPLTKGKISIIDKEDADVCEFRWHIRNGYATRALRENKKYLKQANLHRVIMERVLGRALQNGEFVDHANRDRLDNRRANLRLATGSQNTANSSPRNVSGYKCITKRPSSRWSAQIKINGKLKHLGTFDTAEEAYNVYKEAAIQHFGEFARFE